MKSCCKCNEKKTLDNFSPIGNGWHNAICNKCIETNNAKAREYSKVSAPKYRLSIKTQIINAYGGECACCGEKEPQFLALDHINNDGNIHRKELGKNGGTSFYVWVIKNKFPSNLQLLCHNCNLAKAFYGHCPHVKE